ncbi:threonine--tRNA ligase [Candidatus Woesearchaeota archaeon]|nr:MAG: threonine--tRNA ligase [Candidatus Woesearchaeota archaeon]
MAGFLVAKVDKRSTRSEHGGRSEEGGLRKKAQKAEPLDFYVSSYTASCRGVWFSMKILAIHADYVKVEPKKKAVALADAVQEGKGAIHEQECLVVFIAVESRDEAVLESVISKFASEVKQIAEQVKTKRIMLYPYAHLSSDLARPEVAKEALNKAVLVLKELGFSVKKAPFGWYKAFELKCKGHPLSELSREIVGSTKLAHARSEEFKLEEKKVSKEEKVRLSAAFAVAKAIAEMQPKAEFGLVGLHQDRAFLEVKGLTIKKEQIPHLEKRIIALLKKGGAIVRAPASAVLKSGHAGRAAKESRGQDERLRLGPLQREIIEDLGAGEDVLIWSALGVSLVPTLKQPFLKDVGEVKAFKLVDVGSAYWRGNANNEQLTRLYWVGFASKDELAAYEESVREAEQRDHRRLGRELRIFSMHEEAPGMPFFHDNGIFLYNTLVRFMEEEMFRLGYTLSRTPLILNKSLWLRSGHWDHYRENMYFTKIDNQEFAVKPMNCPGHILMYKTRLRSYRDLPIKQGEFGMVHRHELSGVLSGLFRVRCFTQDDAHIFCTEDQIQEQIIELIGLVDKVYRTFGFKYAVELSTKPEKAMGDPRIWELAENSLKDALKAKNMPFSINEGDGAFYGPKIDFHVRDAMGRSWQCGTIQLDFSMPEKFDLSYEGSDGKKHRPVMIHRAIYGSLERFIGILLEHFGGKFPLWLSPMPVRIVTVTDRALSFARSVRDALRNEGIRAELDARGETIGKKVREARLDMVNFIVTIGDKEVQQKKLAVRDREGKVEFGVDLDEFLQRLKRKIAEKSLS